MVTSWVVADDGPDAGRACEHVAGLSEVEPRSPDGCEDCLREGTRWVHLRVCLECGHVGCCDSSPRRHATAHWSSVHHPVVRSLEPGEDWGWCYADELMLVPADA